MCQAVALAQLPVIKQDIGTLASVVRKVQGDQAALQTQVEGIQTQANANKESISVLAQATALAKPPTAYFS